MRTNWWTQEVQELVKGKKRAFREWLNTKSSTSRQLYTNARKVAADAVKKAKEESWKAFGEDMESNYLNASEVFWQTLRRIRNGKRVTVKSVKDKDKILLR